MVWFRFISALLLITGVSVAGIALENRELALKRAISLQHYRNDQLLEERSRLQVRLHQLHGRRFPDDVEMNRPQQSEFHDADHKEGQTFPIDPLNRPGFPTLKNRHSSSAPEAP